MISYFGALLRKKLTTGLQKILILALLPLWAVAQPVSFVENKGQWQEDFDYKLELNNTSVFLEGNVVTVHLTDLDYSDFHSGKQSLTETDSVGKVVQHHAYQVSFVGAAPDPEKTASARRQGYHNYLLSDDPSRWKSHVGLFGEVTYQNLYPGIDLRYYFSAEGNLKYDLVIHPGADPSQVKLLYKGVDDLALSHGHLLVKNSVEEVIESAPYTYQSVDGEKKKVESEYVLDDREVSFAVGDYNSEEVLVIDPKLIFSSYSGSNANNFGYTATYSEDGGLYAGGIVYNDGSKYPLSLGAFQRVHRGGEIDIGISKFSSDGSVLEYSTYIGGLGNEMPYSLFEMEDKSLVIFGSTGSSDFPVLQNAYSRFFKGGKARAFYGGSISIEYLSGSDAFIARLDSTGGSLLASTFFGGSDNEGFNIDLNFNYGDYFRGEVIAGTDEIFIASSTHSGDLPVTSGCFMSAAGGAQDGFVASFNSDLTTLNWATYVGGAGNDHALSIRKVPGKIYVAGGAQSPEMFPDNDQYSDAGFGGVDGYVLALDEGTGAYVAGTYNGTASRDVNYFLDIDHTGEVYVLGQTRGAYPQTDSLYGNEGSAQYLHQFSPDLMQSRKSTTIGDESHNKSNFSPTAFMVDECRNLYLSGWGGGNNSTTYGQGTTHGLPVTLNATQDNTDGQDFYFMVMDATWKKLNYASFFGGFNDEHVDGGTSRFSKDGTIYQAVCAGCLGQSYLPTTPNAHSRLNGSGGCNMAAIKMQIEATEVIAEVKADRDSSCIPYTANLTNTSYNGDVYHWTLPDGTSVSGDLSELSIDTKGEHILKLVAIDTTCGFVDSINISFHGFEDSVHASFEAQYDSCSNDFEVAFINHSSDADTYIWDFGDGKSSGLSSPVHRYTEPGEYQVQLVTQNSLCERADTAYQSVSFEKRISSNEFQIDYQPCTDGTTAHFSAEGTGFQEYLWDFGDGEAATGRQVEHDFKEAGTYSVHLSLRDSLCKRYLEKDTTFSVYDSGYVAVVPNIFTPNGDGLNDYFGFPPALPEAYVNSFSMQIFSRWGSKVYQTKEVGKPWDGMDNAGPLPEGVYFYVINFANDCNQMKTYKGYVHLSK